MTEPTTRPSADPEVAPPTRRTRSRPPSPARGVAVGLALVLAAVVAGVVADALDRPATGPEPVAGVEPTGRTTTVRVVAEGMRFRPDRIVVPRGDRLVIELTNADRRRHDLVLETGPATGPVDPGATVTLDAGVIGGTVEGWCSLPGHRAAGMTLTITVGDPAGGDHDGHGAGDPPAGEDERPRIDPLADPGPGFTARDATAPATPTGRVHQVELRVQELEQEIAPGVRQTVWTFGGSVPGPVLRGKVGDTFEITLVNDGSLDHGVDFHASALAPDGPMRPVGPGEQLVYRFTATRAGVWMYHCSTAPMLHHIGNGMYGVVIIDPPDLPPADREFVLVQSEFYLGPPGEPGDLARMLTGVPDAVVFNGYAAQYHHRPLVVRPGERVRFYVLNAGPNRTSAFHVVGTQFDTVFREGRYELRPEDPGGAQVLDLVPAAGGFVETVFPEPGHYPFVSHVMADAERGAHGVVVVEGK